jgi:diaminohydroxyphosphoribosylaminopyrimidine deaminase/5-amino-6-(5-phosphoribosylamino)uracil reductase
MLMAINQAKQGIGKVSPNPLVGAVILKNDEFITSGYHRKYGDKHAEICAIESALESGVDLEGCTIVVNLEPCSHEGKQPPCAPAIIEAKFSKVVIGMQDPNPLVAGQGIQMLNDAGIETLSGVLEDECKWLNRFFSKHITEQIPYVIIKHAQSINGEIADFNGKSKWISCEKSLKNVHKLRAEVDAVGIGKGTALTDNPTLTVRLVEGRNPYRVLFDTNLTTPLDFNLFKDDERLRTIVLCSGQGLNTRKAEILKTAGIIIEDCPLNDEYRIDIKEALKLIYRKHNIGSILVEGGNNLLNTLLKEDIADEYHTFIAPLLLAEGINAYQGEYVTKSLDDSLKLKFRSVTKSGDDIYIISVKK